jgi:hypothetical protein
MKNIGKLAALIGFFAVSGCHSQLPVANQTAASKSGQTPLSVTRQKLLDVAGPNAIDCGHVEIKEDKSKINSCVDAAIKTHSAFMARYERMGIDSRVMTGLAENQQGEFFTLLYDSDSSGGGSDLEFISENQVVVRGCREAPKHESDGTITCQ